MNSEMKLIKEIKETHTIIGFQSTMKDSVLICKELMKHKKNSMYYPLFNKEVKENKIVIETILRHQTIDAELWMQLPLSIKTHESILCILRTQNIYDFLDDELKNDLEIILQTLSYYDNPHALRALKLQPWTKKTTCLLYLYPNAVSQCINLGLFTVNDSEIINLLSKNIANLKTIDVTMLDAMEVATITYLIITNPRYFIHFPTILLDKLKEEDIAAMVTTSPMVYESLPTILKQNKRIYQSYFIASL